MLLMVMLGTVSRSECCIWECLLPICGLVCAMLVENCSVVHYVHLICIDCLPCSPAFLHARCPQILVLLVDVVILLFHSHDSLPLLCWVDSFMMLTFVMLLASVVLLCAFLTGLLLSSCFAPVTLLSEHLFACHCFAALLLPWYLICCPASPLSFFPASVVLPYPCQSLGAESVPYHAFKMLSYAWCGLLIYFHLSDCCLHGATILGQPVDHHTL